MRSHRGKSAPAPDPAPRPGPAPATPTPDEPIAPHPQGCVIRIHAQPGAKCTGWGGRHGNALKLRVAAPPIEGRANAACIEFLAEAFGCPRAQIELLAGASSREKRFLVHGMDAARAKEILP
jgi:hypothetical protein